MNPRAALLVALLCCGSLVGWPGFRTVEQAPAALLLPADNLVGWGLPDAVTADPELAEDARRTAWEAWEAWCATLVAQGRPVDDRYEARVVPVLSSDRRRQELVVRVPEGSVVAGSPVTHQGVLLGFLRPWAGNVEEVERGGRAKVALLGHGRARPVAALWQAGTQAQPVHFLLESGAGGPQVAHTSTETLPPPGQLAWTRDVSRLGDPLPAGLLVGRVSPTPAPDTPGGGLADRIDRDVRLEPLLDPHSLGHVVVETLVDSAWAVRGRKAELVHSGAARRAVPRARQAGVEAGVLATRGRLRVDAGLVHGVQAGDLVAQDGALVGVVETAGPLTSVVRRGLPSARLLVVSDDGEVVPCGPDADTWPAGWRPTAGSLVVTGHRELGGLWAGEVASLLGAPRDAAVAAGEAGADGTERFVVALPEPDPGRPVLVVPR